MKKRTLMITILLAFFGCVLIGLSIFVLYRGSFNANTNESDAKKQLDDAKQKIETLNQELEVKSKNIVESELKLKQFKSESLGQVAGQNLPIVEISNVDIAEDDDTHHDKKKVHKLMYNHQIRFALLNVGKSSLKEVIFSIKDIYNDPKTKTKKHKGIGHADDASEIGLYDNIEVNTLNLKSKKMIYTSNLPSSFGVGDYSYHLIVEWSQGFYQMNVIVEEIEGKLKFKYEYYDVDGNPIKM
jgi:hypothetical protein